MENSKRITAAVLFCGFLGFITACSDSSDTSVLCDADGDRDVDAHDINAITGAYGTLVEPGDVRDIDGDGVITESDAQQCADQCDFNDCIVGGDKPNILLILADDLSYDQYGFAGHPTLQTPSLDALAAQSVRFPSTYVSSTCRPSLATLLTGLPEHVNGVTYQSAPPLGNFSTVADRLASVGYSSYQAGKFWEGPPDSRGFTDFLPYDAIGSFYNIGNLEIGRTTSLQPIYDFMAETTSPWFIWFSPYMPHKPHDAPSEYTALYEGLGLDTATIEYFGMISWFDSVVGELLQGVSEDTVVIYLADNGYVQSASGGPEPDSKNSSYEHGIRTQLLIRHPSSAAVEHVELANAWDVTATVLSIAGAYHDDLPGRALLHPLLTDSPAYGSRSALQSTEEPSGVLLERWIRDGDWKLVDDEAGDDRLNNLVLDPDEIMNQIDAPENSQLQLDLQNELETWWLE